MINTLILQGRVSSLSLSQDSAGDSVLQFKLSYKDTRLRETIYRVTGFGHYAVMVSKVLKEGFFVTVEGWLGVKEDGRAEIFFRHIDYAIPQKDSRPIVRQPLSAGITDQSPAPNI